MTDSRTYAELRQEVQREVERKCEGKVIIPLTMAMDLYGYEDRKTATERIRAPRIAGERRVVYFITDIVKDITQRRIGNVEGKRNG